jgi:hypothetical protein
VDDFTGGRGIGLAAVGDMPRLSIRPVPAARACRPLRWRALLWGLLVAATAGCKGDGGGPVGPEPVIAGRWTGTARAYTVQFTANFTQGGEAVGGSGSFSSPLASGDFVVSGTLRGREVDLVLTSDELGATAFIGRFVAADRIEGTFDPNGSYELDLTLDRE